MSPRTVGLPRKIERDRQSCHGRGAGGRTAWRASRMTP